VGEHHRLESIPIQNAGVQQSGSPLDPTYCNIRGSDLDRSITTQIHIASYHYASAAGDIIDDDRDHYVNWFGRADAEFVQTVRDNFQSMKTVLESDVFTYKFDGTFCSPSYYALG
jgi:hypothetical protein